MFGLFIQKSVSVFLLIISFFVGIGTKNWDDSMDGKNFPIISVGAKADNDIRVMSYNIRCDDVCGVKFEKRRDIIARQINDVQPDSVGLQECPVSFIQRLPFLLPQYGRVGLDRDKGRYFGSGEYAPVLYLKAKYIPVKHGCFWLSDTPNVPSKAPDAACNRTCSWVVLKNRFTGEKYVHVNSHLDHVSEEARVNGAKYILDFIGNNFKGLPVVFTADMNTTENGEAYKIMSDILPDAAVSANDAKLLPTFHGGNPDSGNCKTIDFILCSKEITVNSFRTVTGGIDNRMVSDHFPLYADIKISR